MSQYYHELWTAAAVLGGTLLLNILLVAVLAPWLRQLASRFATVWLGEVISVFLWPAMGVLLVAGLRMALLQFSSLEDAAPAIIQWSQVLTTIFVIWGLIRFSNFAARGRIRHLTESGTPGRVQYINALRKVAAIAIAVVGAMTIIGQMGYKITPLLTGLGIGGLAVALALQDTLANFFAGFYMMFDQPVRVGDYIQLKTGEEGFVQEIGWRNTRLRPWTNSEIVVPNSVLAQTIFINHYLPVQELSVIVECGVSYYSDLEHVEQVTREVAIEVMQQVPGAAETWDPLVLFHTFGDSNVEFRTILRTQEFASQYRLRSEFVKALHRRFAAEGIEISFPMRKVEVSQLPPIEERKIP